MIVGAEVLQYDLPFSSPVAAGDGIHESRSGFLFGLAEEEGRVGWGEAAPLPGWTRESPAQVEAALRAAANVNSPNSSSDTSGDEGGVNPTPKPVE